MTVHTLPRPQSLSATALADGSKARQKLVVVGNGMAPGRALDRLFEQAPGAYDVTIFNAEPRVNYDRIMLSPVLSGEKSFDQIVIHGDGWYVKHGVTLYKGATAVSYTHLDVYKRQAEDAVVGSEQVDHTCIRRHLGHGLDVLRDDAGQVGLLLQRRQVGLEICGER